MPIKLVHPRKGKSPNFTLRGTYFGVTVDRTTGTPERAKAREVLKMVQADIERGRLTGRGELTFAGAALSYVRAGGTDRFLRPIADHFGETPVADIDQAMIDEAAVKLYPNATAATRNRQVYTPLSAALRHAGVKLDLHRPKGAGGKQRTDWLWPEQAQAAFDAAEDIDPELSTFLMFLCYTGMRLSEAIWLRCEAVRLTEGFAYIKKTKNDDPRPIHLPPHLVGALTNLGVDRPGETVFKFRKSGHLYRLLGLVKQKAGLPDWVTPHTFRHTYATWMRRYGGLDAKGLVATGAWKDERSASRYSHVVVSEEAVKADLLPAPTRRVK